MGSQTYRVDIRNGVGHFGDVPRELIIGLEMFVMLAELLSHDCR
jgi:hypothetical protein